MRSLRIADARRVVVRAPNWLGDLVMMTPGLMALRRAAPHARIAVALPPPLVPLLEGAEWADELRPLASRHGGASGWRADIDWLRRGRFDLGVVVPESISSALLMRLGGVRQIAGFARDPIRRALLHFEAPADPAWGRRRLVAKERFVSSLLDALGVQVGDESIRLVTTSAETGRLAAALAGLGYELATLEQAPPIVLAPGAGFGSAKCWPAESFAALGDRLHEAGHSVLLVGAPGESDRIHAVQAAMRHGVPCLDGVLDVGALKALLARSRALVANDAGARHVAVAFGVPCVIFFGPTAVEKTAANLERVAVLEREEECRPCYRRRCPIDHRCLRRISVDQAWEGLIERGVMEGPPKAGQGHAPDSAQSGSGQRLNAGQRLGALR